jgi:hypothetical protein
LAHQIEVHTSSTLCEILNNREATGKIAKWAIESNAMSSWVRRKGTTQVMYIVKLKDGPKRVTKTFSVIWKWFSKWYDGEGEMESYKKGF